MDYFGDVVAGYVGFRFRAETPVILPVSPFMALNWNTAEFTHMVVMEFYCDVFCADFAEFWKAVSKFL